MLKAKIQQSRRYKALKRTYETYERFLVPGMLFAGFIVDVITFRTIQLSTAFLLLAVHLLIITFAIGFIHAFDAGKIRGVFGLRYVRLALPLFLQFSFGALLSASFIFYWFSGAFSVSWPIVILIALLMIFNETFREYFERPLVQLSVYYFVLFSYFSLVLPFLFNSIQAWVFLVVGFFSLAVMFVYLSQLVRIVPAIREIRSQVSMTALFIFAIMNAFYFSNVIPPIPLSLREAEVVHRVERTASDYILFDERESILQRLIPGKMIHIASNEPVYVFASIFAPTDLNTTIVHDWQYFDEQTKNWVDWSNPSYAISGGRESGYRGYSFSSNVRAGKWRVDIETKRGQVLGRVRFRVEHVQNSPELEENVK